MLDEELLGDIDVIRSLFVHHGTKSQSDHPWVSGIVAADRRFVASTIGAALFNKDNR